MIFQSWQIHICIHPSYVLNYFSHHVSLLLHHGATNAEMGVIEDFEQLMGRPQAIMSLAIECCSGGPTTEKSKWLQDGLPCKSSGPPALPTIPPNFGGWVFVLNSLYCTPIRIFGMHFLIWDPNASNNLLMSQPWPPMFVLPGHPQLILLCQAKSPVAFLLFGEYPHAGLSLNSCAHGTVEVDSLWHSSVNSVKDF